MAPFPPSCSAGQKATGCWIPPLPHPKVGSIPPCQWLGIDLPTAPGNEQPAEGCLNATWDHTPPSTLVQEALVEITCPSPPTEGRGRGHAVTFPFNSLVGPPVVEGWGGRAQATQSPWPPTPEPRVGGWTAPSRGLDKPIHFPSLSRSGETVPTLITWWLTTKKNN